MQETGACPNGGCAATAQRSATAGSTAKSASPGGRTRPRGGRAPPRDRSARRGCATPAPENAEGGAVGSAARRRIASPAARSAVPGAAASARRGPGPRSPRSATTCTRVTPARASETAATARNQRPGRPRTMPAPAVLGGALAAGLAAAQTTASMPKPAPPLGRPPPPTAVGPPGRARPRAPWSRLAAHRTLGAMRRRVLLEAQRGGDRASRSVAATLGSRRRRAPPGPGSRPPAGPRPGVLLVPSAPPTPSSAVTL